MKEKTTFTGYVTKYALSAGIKEMQLEYDGSRYCNEIGSGIFRFFGRLGRDCFRSHFEAKERAEEMRKDKIASLKKQIAKLEKLTFN
jgi:hypothetical protein